MSYHTKMLFDYESNWKKINLKVLSAKSQLFVPVPIYDGDLGWIFV